ncbi:MAG: restriction endonuclease subunit S [Desulfurellaceae bacterium]|nr:restriction endonuclease subunit S [Desulfurellaceae bacterium]
MNAEHLLTHFDRLADAPDAIPRLRRFILDLAVRGKLVEQDPNDEPASELLKRIAAEKARLVKAGEMKKRKPFAPVEQGEQPFVAPSCWAATRLAFIAECLDYMRKPVNGTEREQRIANKSQSELFPYFGATQQQGWIDDYIFDEELVLLGEDGVPFFEPLRKKAYLIAGKFWVNNHAHVFRTILVSHPYLVHYLNVFDYSGRVVGATRSKLNQAKALDIPIMLPPLAEQHRIVAKVDELMALCDRLEAARKERETTRNRLAAASLARLSAPAPDPAVFQSHTASALNNLAPLTTRPDQIKALRQTILSLAVRGNLVEQDPNDEPAAELLKRIRGWRSRAIAQKKIRAPRKPLAPIKNEESPYSRPRAVHVKL